MSKKTMPSLFIGQGFPDIVLQNNVFTQMLKYIGGIVPKPNAVLMISSNWYTDPIFVSIASMPELIYDFDPDIISSNIFDLRFQPHGSPEFAEKTLKLLEEFRPSPTLRGLDSGAWTIYKLLYPNVDVPVFQISLKENMTLEQHYEVGRRLRELRENQVLIIGCGNLIYNPKSLDFKNQFARVPDWVIGISNIITDKIKLNKYRDLINYFRLTSNINLALPTFEHYIPMLYILSTANPEDRIEILLREIHYGTLDMTSFMIS